MREWDWEKEGKSWEACMEKIRRQVVCSLMKERLTAGSSQNGSVCVCVCVEECKCLHVCLCVCLSVFGESLWVCQLRHIPEDPSSGCPAPLAFLAHTQLMPAPGDTLVSDTRSARGGKQQERSHAMCWTYRHGKGIVCTHTQRQFCHYILTSQTCTCSSSSEKPPEI